MQYFRAISRSSPLARIQTEEAHRLLRERQESAFSPDNGVAGPGPAIQTLWIESFGDRHQETSLLAGEASPDFFTRELDEALRAGQADWAVHSAKDLALPLAPDLRILALLLAADQSDSLVLAEGLREAAAAWSAMPGEAESASAGHPDSRAETLPPGPASPDPDAIGSSPGPAAVPDGTGGLALTDVPLPFLPPHARVGTSSPSRRDQLLALRPDLRIEGIRGPIGQRMSRLDVPGPDGSPPLDAVVVATCALDRLGITDRPRVRLATETHPLQGHLALVGLRSRKDILRLWQDFDVRRTWGSVTLVGAGPGDPELITLKGKRLLIQADVILHDALANPALLPEGVQAIFVGKRKGQHSLAQEDTNRLMHRLAREGKEVVRLKGGDPFIFGRGGEELRYLEERLVTVRVVPGISSALAMAASTGISLTDRSHGASLAFCTGYPEERIQVPDADTRVYFMGKSKLKVIRDRHLARGFKPDSPVLLVRNASLENQHTTWTTLDKVVEVLENSAGPVEGVTPGNPANGGNPARPGSFANSGPDEPVLAVFGAAVPSTPPLSWWEAQPAVWYTGTEAAAARRRYGEGWRIIHEPLVRLESLECPDLLPALDSLGPGDWVVFTSRPGVRFFFSHLARLGLDSRRLGGLKIAAVGKSTARALEEQGIRADLVPARESGRGLVEAFAQAFPTGMGGIKAVLPSSTLALSVIPEGLVRLGALPLRVFTYQNLPDDTAPETRLEEIDRILLSSPSAARALHTWHPVLPQGLELDCMGEETRAEADRLWLQRAEDADRNRGTGPRDLTTNDRSLDPLPVVTASPASATASLPKDSTSPTSAATSFARFHQLRTSPALRDSLAEFELKRGDCILPLFVVRGEGVEKEIASLDRVFHRSPDRAASHAKKLAALGYDKVLLFGVEDESRKDNRASAATDGDSLVCQTIRAVKRASPSTMIFTDVCVCAYMDHGHCGVLHEDGIDNDASLPLLSSMALAHARAGADWVAPSAMMDGQVQAIRQALDAAGFTRTGVLGYSAKFASGFYGPFRDAARSAPGQGDRKAYQMDWRAPSQVLPEVKADLDEGAEAVMVKPAMLYLDVVNQVRQAFPDSRLAAYHVSGEYMALCSLAKSGGGDLRILMTEAYGAMKRAGADWIIGYGANLVFDDDGTC